MDYIIKGETLTAIAESIRKMKESTNQYTPESMPAAIESINANETIDSLLTSDLAEVHIQSNVVNVRGYALYQNANVVSIDMPFVETIGTNSFYRCTNVREMNIRSAITIGSNGIRQTTKLERLDFDRLESIGNLGLAYTDSMEVLIIRTPKMCVANGDPLKAGAIHERNGYIYVPKSLIEEYKAATNWSLYADKFRAIEDYPEITGGDTSE